VEKGGIGKRWELGGTFSIGIYKQFPLKEEEILGEMKKLILTPTFSFNSHFFIK